MLKIPKFSKNKIQSDSIEKIEDSLVAISLGSYHVGCVIGVEKDSKVQIVGHSEAYFNDKDAVLNILDEDITEKIREILEKAKATSQIEAKKVIFGIPAKYLYSKTSTVRIKRKSPEKKINSVELEEITKKIIQKSLQEVEEKSGKEGGLELLNSDTTYAKIDGYITKNLEGFRGSTVEISTFMSFVDKEILNKILQLSKTLKLELITIVPSIYTVNKLISSENLSNYILVNIAGKNTTTAVVFANEINIVSYFSLGQKSIINYVAKVSGVTDSEVKDALSENIINETINKNRSDIIKIWAESLKSTLGFIDSVKVYPDQVIIYGLGSELIELSEISNILSELKFKDAPVVKSLKLDDLEKIEDHTKTIKSTSLVDSIALLSFGFKLVNNG